MSTGHPNRVRKYLLGRTPRIDLPVIELAIPRIRLLYFQIPWEAEHKSLAGMASTHLRQALLSKRPKFSAYQAPHAEKCDCSSSFGCSAALLHIAPARIPTCFAARLRQRAHIQTASSSDWRRDLSGCSDETRLSAVPQGWRYRAPAARLRP